MYLKRKADQWLDDWKSRPDHNPVIVRGPRQVGKTETIRRFAKTHYENVVEINFVERPAYRQILADGPSADAVLLNLSRIDPRRRFLPGKTLLFFDEIQACPDIATTLKFFRQDGRFDVIASGSVTADIPAENKLVINSKDGHLEVAEYVAATNEFVKNHYQDTDFSRETFVLFPPGNSVLFISGTNQGDINAWVEVEEIHETV